MVKKQYYVGLDESMGPNVRSLAYYVACVSTDPKDASPGEKRLKDRSLGLGNLCVDSLYFTTERQNKRLRGELRNDPYFRLINGMLKRFVGNSYEFNFYFDGGSWSHKDLMDLRGIKRLSKSRIMFIPGGDRTVPLIHQADRVAHVLRTLNSHSSKVAQKIAALREANPGIDKLLGERRIV